MNSFMKLIHHLLFSDSHGLHIALDYCCICSFELARDSLDKNQRFTGILAPIHAYFSNSAKSNLK
jgi:hypothetical protein